MLKAIKYLILIIFLFSSFGACFAQEISGDSISKSSDDEMLAAQYFQNKEFDKASVLYGKLYSKNQSQFYYNNYLNCLLEMKNFSDAEKVVRKKIKKESKSLRYRVDLGYIYSRAGDAAKAEKEFENVIENLKNDYPEIVDIANSFIIRGQPQFAIKTFQKGRNLSKDDNIFNYELADIYERTGDYQQMTEEYLNLLESNKTLLDQIENRLQVSLNFDPDNKKNVLFRKTLIKRIQQNPGNAIYAELMLWHAIQQKDFESALQQAKSIDRLYKEQGDRIYNLAKLFVSNNEYNLAEDAYGFIIKKGNNNPYFVNSSIELLNVKYKKIIQSINYSKQDIIDLENNYISALNQFGKTSATIGLIKNLASVQGYYLDKYTEATNLLNEAISLQQVSREDKAECKTELADILLMKGDVWEATLLYSQVEKDFKHDTIGYTAKFKNAKLFYYIGEFRWARAELDILKAATSKLIANDAMDLYLLINDNIDLTDSTGASDIPLKMYSRADLYTFRNKNDLALLTLDSISALYSGSSVLDRVLYKKAEIKIRNGQYEEADTLIGTLMSKYSYSVLVDDALFKRAEVEQYHYKNYEKAMTLYEKLFKNYPGSVYAVDARKRFRQLRGDQIN